MRSAQAVTIGTYEWRMEEFLQEWPLLEQVTNTVLSEGEAEYLFYNYSPEEETDVARMLANLKGFREQHVTTCRVSRWRTQVAVEAITEESIFVFLPGWGPGSRFRVPRSELPALVNEALDSEATDEDEWAVRRLYAVANLGAVHPMQLGLSDWDAR